MRNRWPLLLVALATACGSTDAPPPPDTKLKPALQLTLCYRVVTSAGDRSSCASSTPTSAYNAGLAHLASLCGNDIACSNDGTVVLSLQPGPGEILDEVTFETYDIRSIVDQWKAAAPGLQSFLTDDPDVRLIDLRASLNLLASQGTSLKTHVVTRANEVRAQQQATQQKLIDDAMDAGLAQTGPLADERRALADIQDALDRYVAACDKLRIRINGLDTRYGEYRASEVELFDELRALIGRVSASSEHDQLLADAELLRELARTEEKGSRTFDAAARQLIRRLEQTQETLDRALEPHGELIRNRPIPVADLTAQSLDGLQGARTYVSERRTDTLALFESLADGIARRRAAVQLQRADELTRESISDASFLRAQAAFLNRATELTSPVLTPFPRSPTLNLSLVRQHLASARTVVGLNQGCAGVDQHSWMFAGCEVYQRQTSRASTLITRTIPFTIRLQTRRLDPTVVDAALIDGINSAIAASDLDTAAHLHDQAVHLADPQVQP